MDSMDCGPTCVRMVAKFYGKNISAQQLREAAEIGKDGVSILGIAKAAEKFGFRTLAIKSSISKLKTDAPLPCIIYWAQSHFIVLYKISKNKLYVSDPARGLIKYSYEEFEERWASIDLTGQKVGAALLLEPKPDFKDQLFYEDNDGDLKTLKGLFGYFGRYKRLLFQLLLGLLLGSFIQLIFPFLTQSVVDTGIMTQNLNFIHLVLMGQLMLFLGRTGLNFIQSWILLHISTRINLSILSDFLGKLLRLPISFFESKQTGDILQRIGDHKRIESFLTSTSLNVIFSILNLIIFSVVLAAYNGMIFFVFILSSIFYALWIILFLRSRRNIDQKRFSLNSKSQSSLMQLVQSVPELKLNNATLRKRWAWERLQISEFVLNMKSLALEQYQQSGATFLNEGKNIFITFLAATAVVKGEMTLGTMLAIQYILGQLNSPAEQIIGFLQRYQDAKLSLDRLNEINIIPDEEQPEANLLKALPDNRDIHVEDLSFTYPGAGNEPVLCDINLKIPQGKITAIVGSSGSGKTTLLKILLKFIHPQRGRIVIGNIDFRSIGYDFWRSLCGTVMQDGYIFSDTIANNISLSDEIPDLGKVTNAIKMANLQDFVDILPMSYNTRIGQEGNGVSQGQRQRILIARAVYKNPEFLFFDEATNSLDTENEKIIMANLENFFNGRTVVVVAHRLSTVKNADQIIVLEKGRVIETGNHRELCTLKGRYFELIKNQLDLEV